MKKSTSKMSEKKGMGKMEMMMDKMDKGMKGKKNGGCARIKPK